MTEPLPVWNMTPEGEAELERVELADMLANIGTQSETLAALLASFFGPLREKLPPDLAEAVTLQYALTLMARMTPRVEYRDGDE